MGSRSYTQAMARSCLRAFVAILGSTAAASILALIALLIAAAALIAVAVVLLAAAGLMFAAEAPRVERVITSVTPEAGARPDAMRITLCEDGVDLVEEPDGTWFGEDLRCGDCPLTIHTRTGEITRTYASPDPFPYCRAHGGYPIWTTIALRPDGVAEVQWMH